MAHWALLLLTILVVVATLLITTIVITLPTRWLADSSGAISSNHTKANASIRHQKSGLQVESSVAVLVLGDVGHSPRMQYHTTSIANHGGRVDLVGYLDSDVLPEITRNGLIRLVPLSPSPGWLRSPSRALFPILGPLKVLWQAFNVYYTLCYRGRPCKYMLVQNPPSIPTLLIALLVCRLRNTRLIIDWHNLGHTILGLKLGPRHPMVLLSSLYERAVGRSADGNIAVSHAMCRLLGTYGITATAVFDRPAKQYRPLTSDERRQNIRRLPVTAARAHGLVSGTTRLLVSSTSWTADEDFSVLLEALELYSATAESDGQYPALIVVITGKGPLKTFYESRIKALRADRRLAKVEIYTAWLSMEDYAALLGSADLGVSLHCSSSGVDLPMKVVDMFGCGLPVVGYDQFEAWAELVKEGVNGRGFRDADGLQKLLRELLGAGSEQLDKLKAGALSESRRRWEDEWPVVAAMLSLT